MEIEILTPMLWQWLELALRWFHVICGIAWIGSSFYFIALDLGLRQAANAPKGVHGEEWQVHGGGFYHIQKYLVAPEAMPEHLTWFKWESYMTWVSGFVLLVLIYYLGAELYLIDESKIAFTPLEAICVSLGSLAVLWLAYNALCKSRFGENNTRLMLALYACLVALAWGYEQIFTGRAAFIHLGAVTATIMSANVLMVIIPNQRIVVADLKAGRTPDPRYGKTAKQRSIHNNYLTLPVLFLMLSNHYPLAFATEYSWVIASLVFLMGVSIRHYFNTRHARRGNPLWTWGVTIVLFLIIVVLSLLPVSMKHDQDADDLAVLKLPSHHREVPTDPLFGQVVEIVQGRCAMCHAHEPYWAGIAVPPKGVVLESEENILAYAEQIFLQSAISEAMPPANTTFVSDSERDAIRHWYLAYKSGEQE